MATYNLAYSNFGHWTATIGGFSGNPLRSAALFDNPAGAGSEVETNGIGRIFAGAGASNAVQRFSYNGAWNDLSDLYSPGNGGYGSNETLDARGDRLLVGATGGAGRAYLYSDNGSSQSLLNTLIPYRLDSSVMVDDSNGNLNFGSGAQLVTNGVTFVGTNNADAAANKLYGFRQRGPAWTVATADIVPQALATAKGGTAVAVDGNTAVIGAPDYDNRGAAFVYTADANGNWTLNARLQGSDIAVDDGFGSSVAVSGSSLIVGAPDKGGAAGAVYLFQRVGSGWSQVSEFDGASAGARLGGSVAVFGTIAAAGAPGLERAYVYNATGTSWIQVQTLAGRRRRGRRLRQRDGDGPVDARRRRARRRCRQGRRAGVHEQRLRYSPRRPT